MSGHTPGPWHVSRSNPLRIVDHGPRRTTVARVLPNPQSVTAEIAQREAEEHARLIAAAPELLEVLARYVQQDLAQGLTDNNLYRTAHAVIAKATGEQS